MIGRSVLLSVAFWGVFAGVLRVAVIPPESCGEDNRTAIAGAAVEAKDWMVRNQLPDGRYVYAYNAEQGLFLPSYSEVRHAGVTMALYQAAGRYADADALTAAGLGLAWMLPNLKRAHGWAALVSPDDPGEARLGGSALALVGLAERRLATGEVAYDGVMHELARFLVAVQREDGGFHVAWRFTDDAPDTEATSKYFPGEAFWALALMHEAFPGEGWDLAARKAADYIALRRDEVEDIDFPPWADQWAAYGLAEMSEWGLSDAQIGYARRLAARFGLLVRTEAQREDGWLGTLVRGRKSRAAGTGTWVEALAALWRLASTDDRMADLRPKIRERLTCAAGILAARQITEEEAAAYPQPDLVRGAWFRSGETRMDDQQHAFSGLLYTVDALDGRVRREPGAAQASSP